MLPLGLCAQLACIWEVFACKPGNVTPLYDFETTTFLDFLVSAAAIAPVIESAPDRRVGETILEGIRATRRVTSSNTNLGILLLLAPLAAVSRSESLQSGLPRVLERLDLEDARLVYKAIHLAEAGGLGHANNQDVQSEPTLGLREVMGLAADLDLIAHQYVDNFRDIFHIGIPALSAQLDTGEGLETAIIYCHLRFMASYPDSLIARKCGQKTAEEAQAKARRILEAGWPDDPLGVGLCDFLDDWLRADGNRRNPGTSADLVTASLFVLLREGTIHSPTQYPWESSSSHE
jgi:triphosphoribosyl-dephospho-CoA synthase